VQGAEQLTAHRAERTAELLKRLRERGRA
jgi:hypothetical protein